MPVKRCVSGGKDGWKFGDKGKCYTDEGSDKANKDAALKQGRAIQVNKKLLGSNRMIEKKKVKRYKKLIIEHDCLVPKGAMQVETIFKEDKDGHFIKPKETIVKFDDSKQMMYNIMVLFGKVDTQDMILDDEKVRTETQIDYLANGDKILKFTHQKNEDDEPYDINAHVAEVYVVKEGDTYFPEYVGSIARCAYFPDKEEYDIIKEMEFESSIEGIADLEEIDIEKKSNGITHKIKDLLKKIFGITVEKDFDSVMENRKNTDLWNPINAFEIAMDDIQWKYIYGSEEKDVDKFKKEAGKIVKQFMKYINSMTFEKVIKEVEEKSKGDAMENREEVQAMIDKSLKPVIESLGLEEGQTLADVITKAIGEAKPPKPVVVMKDSEEKDVEVDLGDLVKGLVLKVSGLESNETIKKADTEEKIKKLQTEMDDLTKELTDNVEKPEEHPEEKEIEKSDEETKAHTAG